VVFHPPKDHARRGKKEKKRKKGHGKGKKGGLFGKLGSRAEREEEDRRRRAGGKEAGRDQGGKKRGPYVDSAFEAPQGGKKHGRNEGKRKRRVLPHPRSWNEFFTNRRKRRGEKGRKRFFEEKKKKKSCHREKTQTVYFVMTSIREREEGTLKSTPSKKGTIVKYRGRKRREKGEARSPSG